MKILGNIIWFLITGLFSGLAYGICGIVLCVTIIFIPFGLQCFKLSRLCFWPFGADVQINFDKHPFANVIWLILSGLWICIGFFIAGAIWCVTIIGIPFGLQCFKLAKLSLLPFGATINGK